MDSTAFRTAADRLKEINEVVVQLDETIRPAAFAVLRSYVDGTASATLLNDKLAATGERDAGPEAPSLIVDPDAARSFLADHYSDTPADNVKAIGALVYSHFGASEFSAQEVRELAHEAGVTVPDRVDVTLGSVKVDKKPLFQKVRSGIYRPTVHGEKYFKTTFQVTKGTGRRP